MEHRLTLLALALEDALSREDWPEAAGLFAQREAIMTSMQDNGELAPADVVKTVMEIDARSLARMAARKHNAAFELRAAFLDHRSARSYVAAQGSPTGFDLQR